MVIPSRATFPNLSFFFGANCQSFGNNVIYFNITIPEQRIVSNDINIMFVGPLRSCFNEQRLFLSNRIEEKLPTLRTISSLPLLSNTFQLDNRVKLRTGNLKLSSGYE